MERALLFFCMQFDINKLAGTIRLWSVSKIPGVCDKTAHSVTEKISVVHITDHMLEMGVGEHHAKINIVAEPVHKHADDIGGVSIRQRKTLTAADMPQP